MSRFKVGQRVVCIKSHSQGVVKKGNVYIVSSMDSCCTSVICVDGYEPTIYNVKRTTCKSCKTLHKDVF